MTIGKKILLIAIAAVLALSGIEGVEAAKPKRQSKPRTSQNATSKSVKRQQRKTRQKIKETDEQIKANNRLVANKLRDLNLIQGKIKLCNDSIADLQRRINEINIETKGINDTVVILNEKLETLRVTFAASLRSAREARSSTSKLNMIFASENFAQAYRRLRAVEQFGRWREKRVSEIDELKIELENRKLRLDTLASELKEARTLTANRRAELQQRQKDANAVVKDLKSKEKVLKRVLKEQQEKAAQLDAELDRIIAEEARRAEEERRQREAEEAARRKAEEERLRAAAEARQKQEKEEKKSDKKSKKKKDDQSSSSKGNQSEELAMNNMPTTKVPDVVKPAKTFASSRGLLPWPVDGYYTIVKPFGRQSHPLDKNIKIDNSGIDLQTATGATVKSVYDGEVSAVFCPDQVTHVVVVRHGDYVTVYANLGELSVVKGDKVKCGQALGKVYVDQADGNRSVLHFEIRNGANPKKVKKENPKTWLK